jgi:DNA polymerase-3 subunit delta
MGDDGGMLNLKQLKQQLQQGEVAPVYLIQGEESAIADASKRLLKSLIPEDMLSMNYGVYDGHETPLAQPVGEASEPPFFGDYREVVINNAEFLTASGAGAKQEEAIAELAAYLKDPLPSTILVLVVPGAKIDARKKISKAVKKVATIIDAGVMTEDKARAAIRDDLRQAGVNINAEGINALVARTQGDYSAMAAVLPILVIYGQNNAVIDAAAVTKLVPKQLSDSVFDLVNAVLRRDVTAALGQYRDLLAQKEEPLRLVALLEGQFRLLVQIAAFVARGYTQGAAAERLSVHPYRVKLAWRTVQHLRSEDLYAAYMMLVNTEAAMKRGTVDKKLGFELFVLQFAGNNKIYGA